MNQTRIGVFNRSLAFLLSVIAAIALIISQFTLPFELVLFNSESYSSVIEDTRFTSQYPEIITNILVSQFYDMHVAGDLPQILSNQDKFRGVLKKYVPEDWSKQTMSAFIQQILEYFNFRLPTNSMNVELGGLKSELILHSREISQDYIHSLVNCSTISGTEIGPNATVYNLPPCQPDTANLPTFVQLTSTYLEDLFNQLPSRFSTTNFTAVGNRTADQYFYYYSIARWALRLMPLLTLVLLILIAVLLRKSRPVMLRWIGRLLVITSAITLVFLVILLIGFDQFIALIVNRFLGNLIEGFGVLLLGFIQAVGYQTLVWVVVSVIITLGFGFFLILIARIFKPKEEKSETESMKEDLPENTQTEPKKEITPQTMEEIEEEEKKRPTKKE